MTNKILGLLIFFVIISSNSFSQKVDYTVTAGGNYSFFTWSFYPKINNSAIYISLYNENYISNYTYPNLIRMVEFESIGNLGFFINNNFSLPINKHLSFKTGFGINNNNSDYKITFSTDYESIDFSEDSVLYINPFFVSDENTLTSFVSEHDSTSLYFLKSNFDILSINIPLQLQIKLFNEALLVSSGVSISSLITVKNTPETNKGIIRKYEAENDFEKFFISFHSVIDYNIYKKLYITASYTRSISDLKTTNDFEVPNIYSLYFTKSHYKPHINSITFGVSYKL